MTKRIEQADSAVTSMQRLPISGPKLWSAVGISILVLLPCFWHRRIEAGDLGSHIYNAWLSQLIGRSQAPGLYIVPQWNNVLVDMALPYLGGTLGFAVAEKVAVGMSVLIFFWGAFAFITVVTERAPWFLVPAISMVAYGYTLQMGFLNYYLSIALAFWVIVFVWRGRTTDWIVGLALAGLVLSAHLMGFMWLAGTLVYIKLAEKLSRGRWFLPIAALLAILGVHFYVAHRFQTYDPLTWHVYSFVGFDQLVLYSHRYRALAVAALLLTILIALPEMIRKCRSSEFWRSIRTPLELWVVAVFATSMLWGSIMIPKYATGFTYVPTRLTSITAVLGLCLLGYVSPRRWHAIGCALCAVVFFTWLYQDTGRVNGMEAQVEKLVNGLPQGTRVIQTIFMPPGCRIGAAHILDQACIGRCFAYANYEPASRQFRIRARSGNSLVTASSAVSEAMLHGSYVVQPEDLPLVEIYQCDQRDLSRLCIRDLAAGDLNGQGSYIPTF